MCDKAARQSCPGPRPRFERPHIAARQLQESREGSAAAPTTDDHWVIGCADQVAAVAGGDQSGGAGEWPASEVDTGTPVAAVAGGWASAIRAGGRARKAVTAITVSTHPEQAHGYPAPLGAGGVTSRRTRPDRGLACPAGPVCTSSPFGTRGRPAFGSWANRAAMVRAVGARRLARAARVNTARGRDLPGSQGGRREGWRPGRQRRRPGSGRRHRPAGGRALGRTTPVVRFGRQPGCDRPTPHHGPCPGHAGPPGWWPAPTPSPATSPKPRLSPSARGRPVTARSRNVGSAPGPSSIPGAR